MVIGGGHKGLTCACYLAVGVLPGRAAGIDLRGQSWMLRAFVDAAYIALSLALVILLTAVGVFWAGGMRLGEPGGPTAGLAAAGR